MRNHFILEVNTRLQVDMLTEEVFKMLPSRGDAQAGGQ